MSDGNFTTFFGITAHGPDCPFKENTLSIVNLDASHDVNSLKEIFQRHDKDGSGFLELAELKGVMTEFYKGREPTDQEVENLAMYLDQSKHGQGTISWDEFVFALGNLHDDTGMKVVAPLEYKSGLVYRHDLHKHTRREMDPQMQFKKSMTAAQDTGWEAGTSQAPQPGPYHHRSTDLTQYADAAEKHMWGRSIGGEFGVYGQERLQDCAGFGMGM